MRFKSVHKQMKRKDFTTSLAADAQFILHRDMEDNSAMAGTRVGVNVKRRRGGENLTFGGQMGR